MDLLATFPVERIDSLHDDLNSMMRAIPVGYQSTLIEAMMLCDTVKFEHRDASAGAALCLHDLVANDAEKLGYTVEAVKRCTDGTVVVLACAKPDRVQPWVTWCWEENGGFRWGELLPA